MSRLPSLVTIGIAILEEQARGASATGPEAINVPAGARDRVVAQDGIGPLADDVQVSVGAEGDVAREDNPPLPAEHAPDWPARQRVPGRVIAVDGAAGER